MTLKGLMLYEMSQSQMDKCYEFLFNERPKTVRFMEAERRMVVVRGQGGGERRQLLSKGYRVSVARDEKILEVCFQPGACRYLHCSVHLKVCQERRSLLNVSIIIRWGRIRCF